MNVPLTLSLLHAQSDKTLDVIRVFKIVLPLEHHRYTRGLAGRWIESVSSRRHAASPQPELTGCNIYPSSSWQLTFQWTAHEGAVFWF